jgi:hypothetical protein
MTTGSNGYNLVASPPSFPGFSGPVSWPGAPSCPVDPTGGYTTYFGSKYFSFGLLPGQIQYFNTGVCVAACSAETSYNLAHPPATGHPKVCNHVVSYVVHDPFAQPQGIYCAFFTESWDASYGTFDASFYQGGEWSFGEAYAYTNATYSATYPAICTGSNCNKKYFGGNCGGWGPNTC